MNHLLPACFVECEDIPLKHLLRLPVSVHYMALTDVCVCIQQWQEYQLTGVEEDDEARMQASVHLGKSCICC